MNDCPRKPGEPCDTVGSDETSLSVGEAEVKAGTVIDDRVVARVAECRDCKSVIIYMVPLSIVQPILLRGRNPWASGVCDGIGPCYGGWMCCV